MKCVKADKSVLSLGFHELFAVFVCDAATAAFLGFFAENVARVPAQAAPVHQQPMWNAKPPSEREGEHFWQVVVSEIAQISAKVLQRGAKTSALTIPKQQQHNQTHARTAQGTSSVVSESLVLHEMVLTPLPIPAM